MGRFLAPFTLDKKIDVIQKNDKEIRMPRTILKNTNSSGLKTISKAQLSFITLWVEGGSWVYEFTFSKLVGLGVSVCLSAEQTPQYRNGVPWPYAAGFSSQWSHYFPDLVVLGGNNHDREVIPVTLKPSESQYRDRD